METLKQVAGQACYVLAAVLFALAIVGHEVRGRW